MTSCDCSVDYGELPSVLREETKKSRKDRRCCECYGTIKKGSMYRLTTGLWDGNWETYYTCSPCAAIRDAYCPNGHVLGHLVENIYNCLDFDYRLVPNDDENHDRYKFY